MTNELKFAVLLNSLSCTLYVIYSGVFAKYKYVYLCRECRKDAILKKKMSVLPFRVTFSKFIF